MERVKVDNTIEEWNNAAQSYSEFNETSRYSQFCKEYICNYFDDIQGMKILDAGCGNGDYTKIFIQKGGIITSCDASVEMLQLAKEKNPLNNYDLVNLLDKLPYSNNFFDIIFCNLVLMDIDPIDNAIFEFYRILNDNGILFFSIVHPAFYRAEWERNDQGIVVSKKVKEYITHVSEKQDFWGITMHYHRPLSHYLNKVSEAGFTLRRISEPQVYEDTKIPDIPLYLFAEFIKKDLNEFKYINTEM